MNFTVIVFAPKGAIGQKSFMHLSDAMAFDTRMLDAGNTTSGVLGEGVDEYMDSIIEF